MDFEITAAEATLLRDILSRHLGELRVEVTRTERLDDRRDLQRTEQSIKALIARLDAAVLVPR